MLPKGTYCSAAFKSESASVGIRGTVVVESRGSIKRTSRKDKGMTPLDTEERSPAVWIRGEEDEDDSAVVVVVVVVVAVVVGVVSVVVGCDAGVCCCCGWYTCEEMATSNV